MFSMFFFSFLQRTENAGLRDSVPTRRPPAGAKLAWPQVQSHSLWGQLLLIPFPVHQAVSNAPGVYDVVRRTFHSQQLLPCVTASGVRLPRPGEVLGVGGSQEE